jgi:hypothetical protein
MNECPKCRSFDIVPNSSYKFFDIRVCKICGYWAIRKIEECCRKPFTVVTIDRKSNGLYFLYRQCLNCGGSVNRTKPLSAKKYGNEIHCDFDTSSFESWKSERENEQQNLFDAKKKFDFLNSPRYKYYLYLTSTDWKNKRDQVLKRDKNICQKCLIKTADDVHHLTYENLGNENLIDLISICNSCHKEIHGIRQ